MKKPILHRALTVLAVLAVTIAAAPAAPAMAGPAPDTGRLSTRVPAPPARPTPKAPPGSAAPQVRAFAAGQGICYVAFVHDRGWQNWVCNGDISGTRDQQVWIDSLAFIQWGAGTVCATAFLLGFGWQNERCGTDNKVFQVGTIGLNMGVHGLVMSVTAATLCFRVAVVSSTWADELCTTNGGIGGVSTPFEIDAFLSYFR
jgi:hypothetical protein